MSILVGSASWTDPTLLRCGRFYPPHVATPAARLAFYASRFDMVEVDSPYYALPDPGTAHAWATRTPDDFVFNAKAFRLFTGHRAPLDALPADLRGEPLDADLHDELWRRYLVGIEPLRMAGKLGAVHLQFAPGVRNDDDGRARVARCVERLEGHTAAVEFRHRSWFAGDAATHGTLALLRGLGAAHVVVDSPQGYSNTVPAVWEATHPELAVVRLHGRNASAWNAPSQASSGRFIYEYTPDELAELAEQVRRLAQKIADTHVVFNTNYQDQGMRNAAAFEQALVRR